MTLAIILVGTFYLGPMVEKVLAVVEVERIAARQDSYYRQGSAIGLWAGIINSALLVMAVVVSIYKPWKNIKG